MKIKSEDHESKKAQILEAACVIFSKFGFKKTTLEDIADEAGLGKASIYYYYESKDSIFSAVIAKESESLLDILGNEVSSRKTAKGKIEAFIKARYEHFRGLKNLYRISTAMVKELLPLAQKVRKEYQERELVMMVEILENGIAEGELNLYDPKIVALVIMASLKGLDETFISYGKDEDISQGLAVMLKVLDRGLTIQ
jgi:AcrR family transcriptional regulator